MTNAELGRYFLSLRPDETAKITVLNADSGEIEEEVFDRANEVMLDQISDCNLLQDVDLPDVPDDMTAEQEEAQLKDAANAARKSFVGRPVIFRKW